MKYMIASWCLLLLSPLVAWGQESGEAPSLVSAWTAKRIDNPPTRELKVEVSQKPYEIQLRPLLVEQKFVVEVTIVPPRIDLNQGWGPGRRSSGLAALLGDELQTTRLLSNGTLLESSSTRSTYTPLTKTIAGWVKQVPKDRVGAHDLAFFESKDVDQGMVTFNAMVNAPRAAADEMPGQPSYAQSFYIFGRSEKECEARAKALLALLDYGFSRPIQHSLLAAREETVAKLQAAQAAQAEAKAELGKLAKEVTAYVDYTPEILPGLRQQQMGLEVDLAGTRARIEACDLLLTKGGMNQERRGTVEDTKIQAEIELAGFQSRRDKLEEFVAKAKAKQALLAKGEEAGKRDVAETKNVRSRQGRLEDIDAALTFFAPVSIAENTITIYPLGWTTR